MNAAHHNPSTLASRRWLGCSALVVVLINLCAASASADSASTTLAVSATVVDGCTLTTAAVAVAVDSQVHVAGSDSGVGVACSNSGQVAMQFTEGFTLMASSVGSATALHTLVAVDGAHGVNGQADLDAIRQELAVAAVESAKTEARNVTVTVLF